MAGDSILSVHDLEVLYRQNFGEFARVASAICGDEQAGADAVQDAFANALRSLRTFRSDGSLEAWVWRIVVNAARTARARVHQNERHREVWDVDDAAGSEPDADVLAWIGALPERQRETVFLRYFADLDYRGIAKVLDIEIGTVSATLSAAHRTLRQALEVSQ